MSSFTLFFLFFFVFLIYFNYLIFVLYSTKNPAMFDEAEIYEIVGNSSSIPLNQNTESCTQGLRNDDSVDCVPYKSSHRVCGSKGVFSFTYPKYYVNKSSGTLRLTVVRTGGGYGDVEVDYHIRHISTNDSDVRATAQYTTSQTLSFKSGETIRHYILLFY